MFQGGFFFRKCVQAENDICGGFFGFGKARRFGVNTCHMHICCRCWNGWGHELDMVGGWRRGISGAVGKPRAVSCFPSILLPFFGQRAHWCFGFSQAAILRALSHGRLSCCACLCPAASLSLFPHLALVWDPSSADPCIECIGPTSIKFVEVEFP